MTQQPPVSQGFLIIEASRSHSGTPYSVVLLWMSDQADAETSTSQHTTIATDIHGPVGIPIDNPSKPAVEDPRLGRRGPWDRQFVFCGMLNSVHPTLISYEATLIPKQGVLPTTTVRYAADSFGNQM
jgi:hypothetical protein